jgi:hypothetical protein
MAEGDAIRAAAKRTIEPTPFSLEQVDNWLVRAAASGLTPVLVVAPMHRYWASDDVNRRHVELVKAIAVRHGVQMLNYWENGDSLSSDDRLWSDAGHMNRRGAEIASERLATDLVAAFGRKS